MATEPIATHRGISKGPVADGPARQPPSEQNEQTGRSQACNGGESEHRDGVRVTATAELCKHNVIAAPQTAVGCTTDALNAAAGTGY
jgi:hypothetical protein